MKQQDNNNEPREPCITCGLNPRLKSRPTCSKCEYKKIPPEKVRQYTQTYRDKNRAWYNQYMKDWRHQAKLKVIESYGGRCQCCGEAEPAFLTLDHLLNNGCAERRITKVTSTIFSQANKPVDFEKFRLLCFNCNSGRAISANKICPHEQKDLCKKCQQLI